MKFIRCSFFSVFINLQVRLLTFYIFSVTFHIFNAFQPFFLIFKFPSFMIVNIIYAIFFLKDWLLKMTDDQSKHRSFLAVVFITKCISGNLVFLFPNTCK